MALKYISNEVMLQLSATWVNPSSDAHNAILSIADLAAFLPRINSVHGNLSALLQPTPSAKIAAISAELVTIDIRHDGLIRGGFGFLTAMAELFGGEVGAAILDLRELLVPDGLASTQKSYRAEATQAAQLKARISADIKSTLDSIPVSFGGQSKTLTEFVDEWIALGLKIGDLEDEKSRLQDSPDDSNAMATLKTRNLWIRTVNAFVAVADLADLAEDQDRLIFGPLRVANKAATKRAHAAQAENQEEPGHPEGGEGAGTGVAPTTTTAAPETKDQ